MRVFGIRFIIVGTDLTFFFRDIEYCTGQLYADNFHQAILSHGSNYVLVSPVPEAICYPAVELATARKRSMWSMYGWGRV